MDRTPTKSPLILEVATAAFICFLILVFVFISANCASAQEAPKRLNWKPTAVVAAGVFGDTLTTWDCGGERNPTFQVNGDWRRPAYGKMVAYNLIGVGTSLVLTQATHTLRLRHPSSRTARWVDRGAQGLLYGLGARRGLQAGVNFLRCH